MTRDEHDAKCWRLFKASLVEGRSKQSKEAREITDGILTLMSNCEVRVEQQEES